ncbi:MAG: hypothetical protein RSC93_07195 [Erysipelotrichaceae bacterium]
MTNEEKDLMREKYLMKFHKAPIELNLRKMVVDENLANFTCFFKFMMGEKTISLERAELIAVEADRRANELIKKLQEFINS